MLSVFVWMSILLKSVTPYCVNMLHTHSLIVCME